LNAREKIMNKNDQTAATPADIKPNTGQGETRSPAAVGAGPGNQVQDNLTRPDKEDFSETDLKPGAQPDGTSSVATRTPQNEGIEETGKGGESSALD
jgi:hypothetical protein